MRVIMLGVIAICAATSASAGLCDVVGRLLPRLAAKRQAPISDVKGRIVRQFSDRGDYSIAHIVKNHDLESDSDYEQTLRDIDHALGKMRGGIARIDNLRSIRITGDGPFSYTLETLHREAYVSKYGNDPFLTLFVPVGIPRELLAAEIAISLLRYDISRKLHTLREVVSIYKMPGVRYGDFIGALEKLNRVLNSSAIANINALDSVGEIAVTTRRGAVVEAVDPRILVDTVDGHNFRLKQLIIPAGEPEKSLPDRIAKAISEAIDRAADAAGVERAILRIPDKASEDMTATIPVQ